MTVSNFSTTASNNTSINGVNISEGMSPSDVNNALREFAKDIRRLAGSDGSSSINWLILSLIFLKNTPPVKLPCFNFLV